MLSRDLNLAAVFAREQEERATRRVAIPCRKRDYVRLMHHAGDHRSNPLAKIKREHYTGYPGICVVIFLNYAVQQAGVTKQLRESRREFFAERGTRKREKRNLDDVRIIEFS